jgi:hypothetical protein
VQQTVRAKYLRMAQRNKTLLSLSLSPLSTGKGRTEERPVFRRWFRRSLLPMGLVLNVGRRVAGSTARICIAVD